MLADLPSVEISPYGRAREATSRQTGFPSQLVGPSGASRGPLAAPGGTSGLRCRSLSGRVAQRYVDRRRAVCRGHFYCLPRRVHVRPAGPCPAVPRRWLSPVSRRPDHPTFHETDLAPARGTRRRERSTTDGSLGTEAVRLRCWGAGLRDCRGQTAGECDGPPLVGQRRRRPDHLAGVGSRAAATSRIKQALPCAPVAFDDHVGPFRSGPSVS